MRIANTLRNYLYVMASGVSETISLPYPVDQKLLDQVEIRFIEEPEWIESKNLSYGRECVSGPCINSKLDIYDVTRTEGGLWALGMLKTDTNKPATSGSTDTSLFFPHMDQVDTTWFPIEGPRYELLEKKLSEATAGVINQGALKMPLPLDFTIGHEKLLDYISIFQYKSSKGKVNIPAFDMREINSLLASEGEENIAVVSFFPNGQRSDYQLSVIELSDVLNGNYNATELLTAASKGNVFFNLSDKCVEQVNKMCIRRAFNGTSLEYGIEKLTKYTPRSHTLK